MLDVKALLAKILSVLFNLVAETGSYQLANSNVMTHTGGSTTYIKLPSGHYVVFFSHVVRTTQARTELPVIRIVVNNHILGFTNPYYFISNVGGTFRYSYGNNQAGWLNAAGTWNANTDYRVGGVAIMYDTGNTI